MKKAAFVFGLLLLAACEPGYSVTVEFPDDQDVIDRTDCVEVTVSQGDCESEGGALRAWRMCRDEMSTGMLLGDLPSGSYGFRATGVTEPASCVVASACVQRDIDANGGANIVLEMVPNPDCCEPGQTWIEAEENPTCCGAERERRCLDTFTWSVAPWGECENGGDCVPGEHTSERHSCGCGGHFTRTRTCDDMCRLDEDTSDCSALRCDVNSKCMGGVCRTR